MTMTAVTVLNYSHTTVSSSETSQLKLASVVSYPPDGYPATITRLVPKAEPSYTIPSTHLPA